MLPITRHKERLQQLIKENQVLILSAETGSGKSTQIPQMLDNNIVVVQPRRLAAISLARRVASEMDSNCVSYAVRFEDNINSNTRILFCTDGWLLRQSLQEPTLSKYQTIILDEVHERGLRMDVLLGLLRNILPKRKELKIILMSATIDSQLFAKYYREFNPKLVHIPTKPHPVEVFHLEKQIESLQVNAIESIIKIHTEKGPGHILCFMPGMEEIEGLATLVKARLKTLQKDYLLKQMILPKLHIMTLYASNFNPKAYQALYSISEHRKLIICSNIAETSVTIPGVVYVIDSCQSKIKRCIGGIEQLRVEPSSLQNIKQRTGRAGRERPGECYRMITYKQMLELPKEIDCELKRSHLAATILLLKGLKVDVLKFSWIEPPNDQNILRATQQLLLMGAIDREFQLTKIGKQMTRYPLDPPLQRVLIESIKYSCSAAMIDIVSCLSVETILLHPFEDEKRTNAWQKWDRFIHQNGDFFTYHTILNTYLEQKDPKIFCSENNLNLKNIQQAVRIRQQLRQICPISNEFDAKDMRKCFLSGFKHHLAIKENNMYRSVITKDTLYVHPSSVLFQKQQKPDYILYFEQLMTTKLYMRQMIAVYKDDLE
eukprot:NODE_433_length_7485_cov_0.465746.p1 type:complete len:603 gc:universal NODE_433_length_7485_cov_0.465746:2135-327(-)